MRLTPKEKAIELLESFKPFLFDQNARTARHNAKQCALIAVDEILEIGKMIENLPLTETRIMMEGYPSFYRKVREELEKL
jgi:hypothetical protein